MQSDLQPHASDPTEEDEAPSSLSMDGADSSRHPHPAAAVVVVPRLNLVNSNNPTEEVQEMEDQQQLPVEDDTDYNPPPSYGHAHVFPPQTARLGIQSQHRYYPSQSPMTARMMLPQQQQQQQQQYRKIIAELQVALEQSEYEKLELMEELAQLRAKYDVREKYICKLQTKIQMIEDHTSSSGSSNQQQQHNNKKLSKEIARLQSDKSSLERKLVDTQLKLLDQNGHCKTKKTRGSPATAAKEEYQLSSRSQSSTDSSRDMELTQPQQPKSKQPKPPPSGHRASVFQLAKKKISNSLAKLNNSSSNSNKHSYY